MKFTKEDAKKLNVILSRQSNLTKDAIVQVINERFDNINKSLNKRIEDKVNTFFMKLTESKWNSLLAVLTALGLYFAGSTYMNNQAMASLRGDILRLEKIVGDSQNKAPNSGYAK